MIDIAIVSMHAILYIDILSPTFVMSGGGGMGPLPRFRCLYYNITLVYTPSPSLAGLVHLLNILIWGGLAIALHVEYIPHIMDM